MTEKTKNHGITERRNMDENEVGNKTTQKRTM